MRTITEKLIQNFNIHLTEEEKSKATIEKYVRDITALMVWLNGNAATKTAILDYKKNKRRIC